MIIRRIVISLLILFFVLGCKNEEVENKMELNDEMQSNFSGLNAFFISDDGENYSILDRNGVALVSGISKKEFLNRKGIATLWKDENIVISKHWNNKALCKVFEMPEKFSDGYEIVEENGAKELIDASSKKILTLKNHYRIRSLAKDLVVLEPIGPKDQSLILDKKGNLIAGEKSNYFKVYKMNDDLIRVMKHENGKSFFGFINSEGKEALPFKYEIADDFFDGIASVKTTKGWSVIDKKGIPIIPFKDYWNVEVIDSTTVLAQTKDGKYFLISLKTQKIVKNVEFKKVKLLNKSRLLLGFNEKSEIKLLNRTGVAVNSRFFEEIIEDSEDILRVKANGKWGVYKKGDKTILVSPVFESITKFHDDRAVAYLNGKTYIINSNGKRITEFGKDVKVRIINELSYCR